MRRKGVSDREVIELGTKGANEWHSYHRKCAKNLPPRTLSCCFAYARETKAGPRRP